MENIHIRCPKCQRALRCVPFMGSATQVVKRTCKCGVRWNLVLRPLGRVMAGKAFAHQADWQEMTQ